jgi:hypothetical protein
MDANPTINGQLLFTIMQTAKTLSCGRSTIYRKISSSELEVVNVEGIGPRVTARSILRTAGIEPETAKS